MQAYWESAEHAWSEDSIRLINTPSDFARTALFYVQEIGHFKTLSTYYTEREYLDSFLLVYTISGQGRLNYGGKVYPILPQQIFLIDCMNYQHYAPAKGHVWEKLWVHLHGVSARAYYEQFSQSDGPVRSTSPETPIPEILRNLIELHYYKSLRNELLSSKLIVELLTEVILSSPLTDNSTLDTPQLVMEALDFIYKRYNEKLSLDYLANKLSVNKYHLSKLFKLHTGLSPGEYIINLRITRAKELLKYSELTVAEISEKIGVDNVSHFINLFKDRTELTPLSFRKTWKNQLKSEFSR